MELSNELEGVKRHHTVVMVGGKQQHGRILLVTFWQLDVVQCRYPARENITQGSQHYRTCLVQIPAKVWFSTGTCILIYTNVG